MKPDKIVSPKTLDLAIQLGFLEFGQERITQTSMQSFIRHTFEVECTVEFRYFAEEDNKVRYLSVYYMVNPPSEGTDEAESIFDTYEEALEDSLYSALSFLAIKSETSLN